MSEEFPVQNRRKKPMVPDKLTIPERDPNEKPQNWLRASDTKSASAKRKAAKRRQFFKVYLVILFTVFGILIITGIVGLIIFFNPFTHDILIPKGESVRQLTGHEKAIRALAFSPDGKYLVSGSDEKFAILWETETGNIVRYLRGHRQPITSVAFGMEPTGGHAGQFTLTREAAAMEIYNASILDTPPGQEQDEELKKYMVVTGSEDMYVIRWNIVAVPPMPAVRFGDREQKKMLPSLEGIYVSTEDDDGYVDLSEITPAVGHKKIVHSVAVSKNGNYVLTGSEDGTFFLWNSQDGTRYNVPVNQDGPVCSVAISPTNETFATGGGNRLIKIWNLNTDKLERTLSGHNAPVTALAYSGDGRVLLSGAQDNTAILWNTTSGSNSGSRLQKFEAKTPVNHVAVNAAGTYALTNMLEDSAVLWDTNTGKKIAQFITNSPIMALAMSPEEDEKGFPKYVAVATAEKNIHFFEMPKIK